MTDDKRLISHWVGNVVGQSSKGIMAHFVPQLQSWMTAYGWEIDDAPAQFGLDLIANTWEMCRAS